jgi:homopolymeric O-antigen transport system ATP-binding protein
MNEIAISVENLGKQYRIEQEARASYDTLRERIARIATAPFRRLMNGKRPSLENQYIWALDDVSFEIKKAEVVGIIGRNGAGKSTLLKILSRITEPTKGRATVYGRVGSLLEVGTGFHPELSGRENIYLNGAILGMRKGEINRKFDEMVSFAELDKFIDTPVKFYSSGMYVRLAFAVAAHMEPEILLVDEVLAVGDAMFQKKCLGKMGDVAKEGRTVLFVSHNMEAILNLCPRSIVLANGKVLFSGTSEEAVSLYHRPLQVRTTSSTEQHVLFESPDRVQPDPAIVTRIEVLDERGNPKPATYTWDELVIRIHYKSVEDVQNSSIVLELRDFKYQRLVVMDSGTQVPIKKGDHYVDCYLPSIPLSAGEFFIGVGLAVSKYGWIWRDTNLASFQIFGKDVFGLGRPPSTSRMLFAAPHEWRNGRETSF